MQNFFIGLMFRKKKEEKNERRTKKTSKTKTKTTSETALLLKKGKHMTRWGQIVVVRNISVLPFVHWLSKKKTRREKLGSFFYYNSTGTSASPLREREKTNLIYFYSIFSISRWISFLQHFKQKIMGRKKLTAGRDPNLPFICCICGDTARGNNFSVSFVCNRANRSFVDMDYWKL